MKLNNINKGVSESIQLSEAMGNQDIEALLNILDDFDYVLMGGHAISAYTGKPRATKDIDIVTNQADKIFEAIKEKFPEITVEKTQEVIRIRKDEDDFLDIIIPSGGNSFYKNVMKNHITASVLSRKLEIPTLEMAITAKFAAMVSPNRDYEDKMQDHVDFRRMVLNNKTAIDYHKLKDLGDDVYPNGGDELFSIIQKVIEGKPLII